MRYEVPGVPLIAQTQTNSCWYASATMLMRWRQRRGTLFEPPRADQFPDLDWRLTHNDVLPYVAMIGFAQRLGLQPIAHLPRLPTVLDLQTLLMMLGPLWTCGISLNPATGANTGLGGHAVVLAGADDVTGRMLVLDPAPLNVGDRRWRPIAHLGNMIADRDRRPVTFLHYPVRFR